MAQCRSSKIVLMIQWIRTSRLSFKESVSASQGAMRALSMKKLFALQKLHHPLFLITYPFETQCMGSCSAKGL